MSTALTPQQTFEENIKDRLRKDIGDLIPPEVLSQLVTKAMTEMFFTRKREPEHSGYNAKIIEKPSWFDLCVKETMQPFIKDHLDAWLKENSEVIKQCIVDEITKNGPALLAGTFLKMLTDISAGNAYSMVNDLTNKLRERGLV